MSTSSSSLRIGLLDNACHSLRRGYEMFDKGRKEKNALALKEAIIWIHHGIELSIKQLLVQSNEYLIFENVDEAVRKLSHLRKQPGMNDANVLELFDFSEGVYTVGFRKLIDRAAIMLNLSELAEDAFVREKIDELTSYRNKIVHFAVEVKLEEVIGLLGELMEPFLNLLEKEIDDKNFVEKCVPLIRASAEPVSAVLRLKYNEVTDRIVKLLGKFDGQEVPGNLFGVQERIILPKFQHVERESKQKDFRFDLFAKSEGLNWLIEIRYGAPNLSQIRSIAQQLRKFRLQIHNAQLWLIIMNVEHVGFSRSLFMGEEILFSSERNIAELERLLNVK